MNPAITVSQDTLAEMCRIAHDSSSAVCTEPRACMATGKVMPLPNSELLSGSPAVGSSMRSALERAAHHARAYLETLDTGPVAATASREEFVVAP